MACYGVLIKMVMPILCIYDMQILIQMTSSAHLIIGLIGELSLTKQIRIIK